MTRNQDAAASANRLIEISIDPSFIFFSFLRLPAPSGRFQRVTTPLAYDGSTALLENHPQLSKIIRNGQESSGIFKNLPECSRISERLMLKFINGLFRMSNDLLESSAVPRILKNPQESSRILKNPQESSRIVSC